MSPFQLVTTQVAFISPQDLNVDNPLQRPQGGNSGLSTLVSYGYLSSYE